MRRFVNGVKVVTVPLGLMWYALSLNACRFRYFIEVLGRCNGGFWPWNRQGRRSVRFFSPPLEKAQLTNDSEPAGI